MKKEKAIYRPPALRQREENTDTCNLSVNGKDDIDSLADNLSKLKPESQPVHKSSLQEKVVCKSSSEPKFQVRGSGIGDSSWPERPQSVWKRSDGIEAQASSFSSSISLTANPRPDKVANLDFAQYQHVIEIYGFSKDVQTNHLEDMICNFNSTGYTLKWVNDNHCLVVFTNVADAKRALEDKSLFLKARPMEEASAESKAKLAYSPGDWSMPFKARPATDSRTARRIITRHLGIESSRGLDNCAAKERMLLAQQRFEAGRKAKLEMQAREEEKKRLQRAIWEDD